MTDPTPQPADLAEAIAKAIEEAWDKIPSLPPICLTFGEMDKITAAILAAVAAYRAQDMDYEAIAEQAIDQWRAGEMTSTDYREIAQIAAAIVHQRDQTEIATLRRALRPFADAAQYFSAFHDFHKITYLDGLEVRHLRRADRTLKGEKGVNTDAWY